MLLVITKEINIDQKPVTLYSIDDGKTWISRPSDLQNFKQRRRRYVKAVQKLITTNMPSGHNF